jgi:hypothetical protein
VEIVVGGGRVKVSCHNLNYYLTKSDSIYPLYIFTL